MTAAGRFIVIEGPDGTGKTTQATRLTEALKSVGHRVIQVREPGGCPSAERIRALLVEGEPGDLLNWTEALLMNAARHELVERVIRPALADGQWVVCDRYYHSTLAYQGGGLGLDQGKLEALINMATDGLEPDLLLAFALSPEAALTRAREREDEEKRFEAREDSYHARVRAAYETVLRDAAQRGPTFEIDASGSMDAVQARVQNAIARQFSQSFPSQSFPSQSSPSMPEAD